MKRPVFYSASRRPRTESTRPAMGAEADAVRIAFATTVAPKIGPATGGHPPQILRRQWWPARLRSLGLRFWLSAGAGMVVFGWLLRLSLLAPVGGYTQEDIDAAVARSLETATLPSQATRAYDVIRPSVVRVQASREAEPAQPAAGRVKKPARDGAKPAVPGGRDKEPEKTPGESIGTGVVIVDKGVILTNLHVVAGARRIKVIFADGLESEATMIGAQPENDLAVLQAKTIPDDLVAAAMRSSADLAIGDMVVAVGFPFGIGPSVSSGVVSGLRREYQSPEGKRTIGNLIQFDAAANPGNSGGPLVTAEGEVVGIVTGILSPGSQRVFIGIAFAVPIESAAAAAGVPPF